MQLSTTSKNRLPDNTDGRYNGSSKLSLSVTSVQDPPGRELLADERCLSRNDLTGRSPNHLPEDNTQHQQDHAWVWKHLRLKPGSKVNDIAHIDGQLRFSIPTRVQRHPVRLRAGEVIETAGLRFYLARRLSRFGQLRSTTRTVVTRP